MTPKDKSEPRATFTIVVTDLEQKLTLDGLYGPNDLTIAAFWLNRTANQLVDMAMQAAAKPSRLQVAQTIPTSIGGN